MNFLSLAHSVPPHSFTQAECWAMLKNSPYAGRLRNGSMVLLEKVLTGESGIERRHFCTPDPGALFALDGGELNRYFEATAPALAENALRKALEASGLKPEELDAVVVCTCTGYLCPGVSSHLAERMGLRSDIALLDIVGLGCGAAIPLLRTGEGLILQGRQRVACVAVEICSAAFYLDDNPGVLISLCLFGDGASAAILGPEGSAPNGAEITIGHFDTLHLPEHREALRFANKRGLLKNQLARQVPAMAAGAVQRLWENYGKVEPASEIQALIAHPGGRNVIEALRQKFSAFPFEESLFVLKNYGNMSSPSVLIALEQRLKSVPGPQRLWLSSFGAGFSCFSCRITVA